MDQISIYILQLWSSYHKFKGINAWPVSRSLQEGTSNYFKGLMLIFCYLIVAASFFVHMDPSSVGMAVNRKAHYLWTIFYFSQFFYSIHIGSYICSWYHIHSYRVAYVKLSTILNRMSFMWMCSRSAKT